MFYIMLTLICNFVHFTLLLFDNTNTTEEHKYITIYRRAQRLIFEFAIMNELILERT